MWVGGWVGGGGGGSAGGPQAPQPWTLTPPTLPAWLGPAVPIIDGQLSAIAAELEGRDPEEIMLQVCGGGGWERLRTNQVATECSASGRLEQDAAPGAAAPFLFTCPLRPLLMPLRRMLFCSPPAHPFVTHPRPPPLQSRIYNLRETKVIRDLNPADINKLISVSGMVRWARWAAVLKMLRRAARGPAAGNRAIVAWRAGGWPPSNRHTLPAPMPLPLPSPPHPPTPQVTRTSGVIPDQSLALFQCTQCGHEEMSWNDRGKVNEPSKCNNPACQVRRGSSGRGRGQGEGRRGWAGPGPCGWV